MQHRDFPGGHPSQYYSGPKALNFRVLMGSGVVALVWPHHGRSRSPHYFSEVGDRPSNVDEWAGASCHAKYSLPNPSSSTLIPFWHALSTRLVHWLTKHPKYLASYVNLFQVPCFQFDFPPFYYGCRMIWFLLCSPQTPFSPFLGILSFKLNFFLEPLPFCSNWIGSWILCDLIPNSHLIFEHLPPPLSYVCNKFWFSKILFKKSSPNFPTLSSLSVFLPSPPETWFSISNSNLSCHVSISTSSFYFLFQFCTFSSIFNLFFQVPICSLTSRFDFELK